MEILFLFALIAIAFIYSSVGHGGASGYLALMAFAGIAPYMMRTSALILNLFVAGIAFITFYRAGYFRPRIIWPFLITSIPMSFAGAATEINAGVYRFILAVLLLLAVFRIMMPIRETEAVKQVPVAGGLACGALLGLVSGIIGIGGGILLSPLLLIMRWASLKEAASASALFILLNSASGLISLAGQGKLDLSEEIILWVMAGIAGGLAGSYSGGYKLSLKSLKFILSAVLILASIKLIIL